MSRFISFYFVFHSDLSDKNLQKLWDERRNVFFKHVPEILNCPKNLAAKLYTTELRGAVGSASD